LALTLNITDDGNDYNSDLYAYLSYNGRYVALLNNLGVIAANPFGADAPGGMNVTFSDSAAVNIHAVGDGYLTGTYRPDGENIDPASAPSSFNADESTTGFIGKRQFEI